VKTRETLGIKEGVVKPAKRRKPALVKSVKPSKKPSAPKLSELEADVADTLDI